MDGWVTIGTELSTDKFDRQIAELEKKMKREESKNIQINAEIDINEKSLEGLRKQATPIIRQMAELEEKMGEIEKKSKTRGVSPVDAYVYDDLVETYNEQLQSFNKIQRQANRLLSTQDKLKNKQQEINDKTEEYSQKIGSIRLQKHQKDVENLRKSVDRVSNSFSRSVRNAGKLALGIFGIRSAYMMLRQASSQLAQYDQQYATDLEYIRYVLTMIIAPTLKAIIQYVLQGLRYINILLNSLFGIQLFTNGSAEAFNRMKKNAGGVSSAVKEIKKDLLGFDEINRLTEDGTKAGGTGVGMPSIDVGDMEGETPEWLKFLIDNKDIILAVLAGIAGALIAIKVGLGGIKALGIGALIYGIIKGIQDILDYLDNPTWEKFFQFIGDIGWAILGLGLLIESVPVAIAGALTLIIAYLAEHWEEVKKGFNVVIDWIKGLGKRLWDWFFDNIDNIQKQFGLLGVGIVGVLTTILDWLFNLVAGIVEVIRDVLEGLFRGAKDIFDGIIWIFKGNFREGVLSILKGIVNAVIGILNGLINGINAIAYPLRSLIAGIGKVFGKNWTTDNVRIPRIPYVKTGAIINMPNKGTLVGGQAFGGEAGREGVIPLTDQQAMAELGREIGKNVLVNLTNITEMNGRVISRELKQVQSEQSFAYNT